MRETSSIDVSEYHEIPQIKGTRTKEIIEQNEVAMEQADKLLEQRLDARQHSIDTTIIESPESAKRYLDKAYMYMNAARRYEAQANKLETDIKRKLQPESKRSEVDRLRRKARDAKKEADRYNRYAKMELN